MFKKYLTVATLLILVALVISACGGNTSQPASEPAAQPVDQATVLSEETHVAQADPTAEAAPSEGGMQAGGGMQAADAQPTGGHMDGESDTPMEHMTGEHAVPEEAMAVANPIAATEDSIVAGASIFAQNCAVCHGPDGKGDGPGAAGLEIKPANLNEDHVQGLTDGGLFYIITNGRSGTAMPAWESTLTEEQRWQVVNFIRTFGE